MMNTIIGISGVATVLLIVALVYVLSRLGE